MTAKETLLLQAPSWSEHDAEVALRAVEHEHEQTPVVDEWGNLDAQTDATTAMSIRDLDGEEQAEFGETIADAWKYQSPR